MLPTVLLALALGYAPNDVSLDDLKRFKITAAEARARRELAMDYRRFYDEKRLRTEEESVRRMKTVRGNSADLRIRTDTRAEDLIHRAKTSCGHLYLSYAHNTTFQLQTRLDFLRLLRQTLGEDDYYAGKLPPICPPEVQAGVRAVAGGQKGGPEAEAQRRPERSDVSLTRLPQRVPSMTSRRGRFVGPAASCHSPHGGVSC
jgi:hypothetical protein